MKCALHVILKIVDMRYYCTLPHIMNFHYINEKKIISLYKYKNYHWFEPHVQPVKQ